MAQNDGEIVIGIKADVEDIKKKLEELEKKGKKTSSTISKSFAAVGAAFASTQVVGAMKSAFEAANKLEKTMLGLQATAKLTGQSFEVLKSSVTSLAKDGVMSIDQAANSMKILAAQGVSAQKSFEFLEAAKKVSAFNNIVGDAGEGVANFVKFLQTGSAELAENMDPSLVAVVKRLGGYAAVTQDATKKQALMNAVIEKGGKMTADYQKFLESGGQSQVAFAGAATTLAQTFGQKLQPAMAAIYNTGAKLLTFLGDVIGKLDSTTVAVVAFSVAGFGAIATFAKTAALLPGVFGSLGASITAALGPIGLVIAAVGALGIAVSALYDKFKAGRGETMFADREKLMQEIKLLEQTGANAKLLADQKEKLKNLNAQIAREYDPLLRKMGEENSSMERKLKLIKELDAAEKILGGKEGIRQMGRSEAEARIKELRAGMAQMRRGGSSAIPESDRREMLRTSQNEILLLEQRLAKPEPTGTGSTPSTSTITKADPEYRFIRARDQLVKLQTEYDEYIKKVGATSELGMQATARYGVDVAAIRGNLRAAIAEYNEERTQAELDALEVARKKQVENIMELATLEGWEKKKVDEELQKMREADARKVALVHAESFARTMQGANMLAGGVAGIARAQNVGQALGGFGGIAQGIGGISERFKAFGAVGQGIAAAGSIVSVLSGLFGKSDEQRAREAEEQKRRDEEAKALLELQANYQKSMLALQEAAAKLPFENLTRNLRLVDIQAQQATLAGGDRNAIESQRLAQRQALMQGVLTEQAGTIGGEALFAGTGSTPEAITQFLNERAAQAVAVAQFMQLIETVGSGNLTPAQYEQVNAQLRSFKGKVPDELYNAVSARSIVGLNPDGTIQYGGPEYFAYGGQRTVYENGLQDTRINASIEKMQRARELSSEITRDTGTAESLLSVIEQQLQTQLEINNNTKATADNTGRLTQMRETTILDLAGGGLRGFGSFFRGAFNSIDSVLNPQMPALATPSAISNSLSIASLTRSWQERTADGIEQLVKIQTEALQLLAEIAINSNRAGDVSGSLSESDLLNIMAKVRSRLV